MNVCKQCGGGLATRKQKVFCSVSCAATFNNGTRGYKSLKKCARPDCGNKIQDHKNAQYCSVFCRQQHKIAMWEHGEWIPETREFPEWLRAILVVEGCLRCGWKEVNQITGLVPCQIEHKNGNSSDHSYGNIEVLCPNCHSLTNTYGALNKGNGRKYRYVTVAQ